MINLQREFYTLPIIVMGIFLVSIFFSLDAVTTKFGKPEKKQKNVITTVPVKKTLCLVSMCAQSLSHSRFFFSLALEKAFSNKKIHR